MDTLRFFQLRLACLNRANRWIRRGYALGQPLLPRWPRRAAAPRRIARYQSVPRRVRRVITIHFFHVFNPRGITHQSRKRPNQLHAVVCQQPFPSIQHLVHQHPTADAIVIGRCRPRKSCSREYIPHLLGDGSVVGAPRKCIRRKVNRADLFPLLFQSLRWASPAGKTIWTRVLRTSHAARNDLARQIAWRSSMRHILSVSHYTRARRPLCITFRARVPVRRSRHRRISSGGLRVPISRCGMLESPVNRNPTRPPRLPLNLFRAYRVPPQIEAVEILPREHFPISVEKRTL